MSQLALADLLDRWRSIGLEGGATDPQACLELGNATLDVGEPLLAFDMFSKALDSFDGKSDPTEYTSDRGLFYLEARRKQALALAESGAVESANTILQELVDTGATDGETMGMLARTCKDLAFSGSVNPTGDRLLRAHNIYLTAMRNAVEHQQYDAAYYNGVNAATMALFNGKKDDALRIADEIREICHQLIASDEAAGRLSSHWLFATLGELELIRSEQDAAAPWYQKAGQACGNRIRPVASMRRQANLLLKFQNLDIDVLDRWLPVPQLVVFQPDGVVKKSVLDEKRLKAHLEEDLDVADGCIGYATLTGPADIVFGEHILTHGQELYTILPSDEFMAPGIFSSRYGDEWSDRVSNVVQQSTQVRTLQLGSVYGLEALRDFCSLYTRGLARYRAQVIGAKVQTCHLSVKDYLVGDLPDLTSDILNGDIHDDPGLFYTHRPDEVTPHVFLPMLFADVKHYSTLTEVQLANFSIHFMGKVAAIFESYGDQILSRRTQGDGLFLVFKDIETAIRLSIELNDMVNFTDWAYYGLRHDLQIRISLDSGPCFSFADPVTGNLDFCGRYVNRAARIEPVTPPGHIYASESFVALWRAHNVKTGNFTYAGQISLPKNAGIIPLYHLN